MVLLRGDMNNKFRIVMCSDLEKEEMVADVFLENHMIATINQDKGLDNMEIEIFTPDEDNKWTLPLDDFIEAIQFAKKG